MKFELRQQFQLESARHLPGLPPEHPCARLHGHSFAVVLRLRGEQDAQVGWVRDYHEIEMITRPWRAELDHRVLNEVPGLENPTSENLAAWIYARARRDLPELVQVIVRETTLTECRYPVL